jgi:predicted AAA+ superfamily ATPase
MLQRKISVKLTDFFASDQRKALLVTGARQVGKTYIIRDFAKKAFKSFVEINFYENSLSLSLFKGCTDAENLLLRISAVSKSPLIPGETLIFLDEIQECPDILTAIKFLVEDGRYRYILSGSLLGIDLKDIRSLPVGYMDIITMYPMDFEEFATAHKVSKKIMDALRSAYENLSEVDQVIHSKMLELFKLYLIVGGMPAVVAKYMASNDLRKVLDEQRAIIRLYRRDIAKYDQENKLYLEEIFALIPSELNNKNKRFILKKLNENFKFSRYNHSFLWLRDAGVALPAYCASEPVVPLLMSKSTNLFKLFLCDVGLLVAMCMNDMQIKILTGEVSINFGSIYENVTAQELKAYGFNLYYFNSKKQGEIDFLVERSGKILPLEIKSGKDYTRHAALDNLLGNHDYAIPAGYVFHNDNVKNTGKIIYLPIYMLMFLQNEATPESIIYKPDFSTLK